MLFKTNKNVHSLRSCNFFIAPFERMGDFAAEKMDVLADRVRTSIKNYNRRYTNRNYHNNVRRVDYDLNYGYDDDDYYYYVR